MAIETERKFLVDKKHWQRQEKPPGKLLRQGYISNDPSRTVRIRIAGDEAWLTLKGAATGFSRVETECLIPAAAAAEMLDHFALAEIVKTRYVVPYRGKLWEVDEFAGANEGLVVAEIELEDEDEHFEKPEWLAAEVTHDPRYYNACLAVDPYHSWKDKA